jgi:hypothetical protein
MNARIISLFFAALLPLSACIADAGDPQPDDSETFVDETEVDPADLVGADLTTPDTSKLAQLSAFVGIPSNYVYNPRLGTLHDYCTKSPDEFPNPFGANANFRGPCARHDLCLGARTPSQTCNNRLWADMISNCNYTYGVFNPVRATCHKTAHIYWIAVTINTHI